MKVTTAASRDIVDRRRHVALGVAGGILATLLGMLGVHVARAPDPDADLVEVVSTALDRGQDFWSVQIPGYRRARVVLYEASTSSGCGQALAEAGPFYCPADERIYLDLAFLRAISGQLARAYVVAHELGHHVQKLRRDLATSGIGVELEADCYAGMWMRAEQAHGNLEAGDVPAALAEAAAVGDDRLCPTCSSERWTHGSSAQRVEAISTGIDGRTCATY